MLQYLGTYCIGVVALTTVVLQCTGLVTLES